MNNNMNNNNMNSNNENNLLKLMNTKKMKKN